MRTVSYERSGQAEMVAMARENGALRGALAIVRATLSANMEHVEEGWPRGSIAECILRIDAALEESQS